MAWRGMGLVEHGIRRLSKHFVTRAADKICSRRSDNVNRKRLEPSILISVVTVSDGRVVRSSRPSASHVSLAFRMMYQRKRIGPSVRRVESVAPVIRAGIMGTGEDCV